MTEQMAIERIRHMGKWCDNKEHCKYGDGCENECMEAVGMAIEALEEVQKYRAIGTVKECQKAIDKQKRLPNATLGTPIEAYVC